MQEKIWLIWWWYQYHIWVEGANGVGGEEAVKVEWWVPRVLG